MAALREAISLAQESNDHVCLQHALVSIMLSHNTFFMLSYNEHEIATAAFESKAAFKEA